MLFDALGTLLTLDPPAPRLRAAVEHHTGIDVGLQAAERAFGAEIDFYLANHMRGGDRAGLQALRDDCAEVVAHALADVRLSPAVVREPMIESITFSALPDAAPALRALRDRGIGRVVVSNWDVSLSEGLRGAGLDGLIDAAVSSAEVGVAKPAPEPLLAGLGLAGVGPGEALYVGDSPDTDVAAARAAGVTPVLVVRNGELPEDVTAVRSLADVASLF